MAVFKHAHFLLLFIFCTIIFSITSPHILRSEDDPYVVVLGITQDAGYPHIGCKKNCCAEAWKNMSKKRMVSCIAIVDPLSDERWIIDATPDFTSQLHLLDEIHPVKKNHVDQKKYVSNSLGISGILLTHAHIGHYTGLMYLGREGVGAKNIPLYAMPRMQEYLKTNGPWSQLVNLHNIEIIPLEENVTVKLNDRISITPIRVPHRDEYSETIGFVVKGPKRSILYIPDIDKWERWERRIEDVIASVDVAFLDGTFFDDGEIPGRSMTEIPHPFIVESMKRFTSLPSKEKSKIRFIHFNHTNPALKSNSSPQRVNKKILDAGFYLAEEKDKFNL